MDYTIEGTLLSVKRPHAWISIRAQGHFKFVSLILSVMWVMSQHVICNPCYVKVYVFTYQVSLYILMKLPSVHMLFYTNHDFLVSCHFLRSHVAHGHCRHQKPRDQQCSALPQQLSGEQHRTLLLPQEGEEEQGEEEEVDQGRHRHTEQLPVSDQDTGRVLNKHHCLFIEIFELVVEFRFLLVSRDSVFFPDSFLVLLEFFFSSVSVLCFCKWRMGVICQVQTKYYRTNDTSGGNCVLNSVDVTKI